MNKQDLLRNALQLTESNIVKKGRSKKTNNDRLLELLLDKQPMTKLEIINQITIDRLEEKIGRDLTQKDFKDEQFLEDFKKTNKTVKNVFEASVCNGQNNASFSYNRKYNDYKLYQLEDGRWTIDVK